MTPEPGPPEATAATDARRLLSTLRPQRYGRGSPWRILDPIVEPEWAGSRVLAAIDTSGAALVDLDGDPIDDLPDIVDSLAEANRTDGLVLDGYLTKQVAMARGGQTWSDDVPSISKIFIGHRPHSDVATRTEAGIEARTFGPDDDVCFVAIDLLWLDDTSLLDVPLLERRRLLDGVVAESGVVRLGAYVRPPVDRWVGSWRVQGFTGVTYKAANSRYLPGAENKDWAIAGMPRR